jgi:DNA polymerase I
VTPQLCYGGVRYLGPDAPGPCLRNVALLDQNARPFILHAMARGMRVDLSHFERMSTLLAADMDAVTEEVRTLTGHYINLDSGDQVADLLFKKLGLKQARPKLTKSEERESVENEVLVAIQHVHPVVPKILKFKELSKLKGTYVDPMPRLAVRVGHGHWRMYPRLGDTRVPSGRYNCKEPNLLAMPNRTERGREVCEGFITEGGWVYLSVDESQIEPRVVAHRSQDPALMSVYFNGEDIYSDFAIAAFNIPDQRYHDEEGWHYPGVDKKTQRFPAKTCILASIYDVTATGLLEQMPIVCANCGASGDTHNAERCAEFLSLWNEQNCQDIINAFYRKYSGILDMRRRDHGRARRFGYVWDDWGRLLHCAGVRSTLEWVVSATLRELGNFPIQATAQGTVKVSQAEVYDLGTEIGLWDPEDPNSPGSVAHPQLQVHDELLFACREDVAEELADLVKRVFEGCVRLTIPIKAGAATSETWGKLVK